MSYRCLKPSCPILALVVAFALPAYSASGQSVLVKRKYSPGKTSYVEFQQRVEQTSTSPRGEQTTTIIRVAGFWETAEPVVDGKTRVVLTFDRLMLSYETEMLGVLAFDTDDPANEDAAAKIGELFGPMLGMSLAMEVDAAGEVVSFGGMEAVLEKLGEEARTNLFWRMVSQDLTDERAKKSYATDPLLIYANRKVADGDTWEASASAERPPIGTIVEALQYKVDGVRTQNGSKVVEIAVTRRSSVADDGEKTEGPKSTLTALESGTAIYDVASGVVVSETVEGTYKLKSPLPGGREGDEPKFSTTDAKVTRTTVVLAEESRKERKLEIAKKVEAQRKALAEAAEDTEPLVDDLPYGEKTEADWTQWGGAGRDFRVNVRGLADKWPEAGPKQIWRRDLGDGYSAIVTDGETLYTMYWIPSEAPPSSKGDHDEKDGDSESGSGESQGDGDEAESAAEETDAAEADAAAAKTVVKRTGSEVVVAIDAKSGKTLWEHKYAVVWDAKMNLGFGPCPNATPMIVGDRLYAIGSMAHLVCLDRRTGERIWGHDLHKEYKLKEVFEESMLSYGYGINLVVHEENLIVPIGAGDGQSILAMKLSDGSLVWKRQDFGPAYAAPQLIDVDGEEQLLVVGKESLGGLDPKTGELKWKHAHPERTISMPVWCGDNTVFISAAYGVGAYGIKLARQDGKTTAQELWHNKKMKIHHGNGVRIGDVIIGASGDFGPAFICAINTKTGKLLWRSRDFAKANFVYADGKLIVMDQDGNLGLARPGKKNLRVLSKVEMCKPISWTVPTLVGTNLYVRDRQQIIALDLSEAANKM